jgi:hypothetical protein
MPDLHLLHMLLVQNLLRGQKLGDSPGAFVERVLFGIVSIPECDEKP